MDSYKDPAFLFYPESFLVGVMYMTDEEVGQYIKLLCIQHQKGHIPDSIMKRYLPAVQEKFIKDEDGYWYNERLEYEIDRRASYTNAMRENGKKGGRPKKSSKKEEQPAEQPRKRSSVADWIAEIVPEELQEPFMEWARMRAQIKKPIPSKTSVARNYSQLQKLSSRVDKQKKIIEQSVDRCWQSFYELKEEVKPKAYREFEQEEEIEAVPMPDEVKRKADALGIRIGGSDE